MITLLIGHRGCGKSSLLQRIKQYDPSVETIDLDRFIEEHEKKSIPDIFLSQGERGFRALEKKYLAQFLVQERTTSLYIAVGAGFEWQPTHGVRCLWVRRPTDPLGRILLDRPRLDINFSARDQRYDAISYEELTIPEGCDRSNVWEENYFSHHLKDVGGVITLLPKDFTHAYTWYWFIGRRLDWGIDAFEVRDDQLTLDQIGRVSESIPTGKTLLSYRTSDPARRVSPKPGIRWDWDLTLGPCPYGTPSILSLHERRGGETVTATLARLASEGRGKSFLKAAIEVFTFDELGEGHTWMMQDPERRVFLPRSSDGRWQWYRLLVKGTARLNFIREGTGSSPDQPYLMQWLRVPQKVKSFAAVLGDPVLHSRTPAVHETYFASRGMPVFSIRVTEEEWKNGALDVLQRLGLRYAAVTSPLKTLAGSRNTLVWDERKKEWCGTNTDLHGLQTALKDVDLRGSVAVWGGAGMFPVLKTCLPEASFYSARTGELKEGPPLDAPDLLVWASGRPGALPPSSWRPKQLFDLDYRQNSPGLDYAERHGIPYTSGLEMFERQAEEQQVFWNQHR
ncbi:MAG: hypothetical protein HY465_03425 [Deltaproteobacteria bacterium]|nr:hypothetical protein [Deltaproteobacteria bacterium]